MIFLKVPEFRCFKIRKQILEIIWLIAFQENKIFQSTNIYRAPTLELNAFSYPSKYFFLIVNTVKSMYVLLIKLEVVLLNYAFPYSLIGQLLTGFTLFSHLEKVRRPKYTLYNKQNKKSKECIQCWILLNDLNI